MKKIGILFFLINTAFASSLSNTEQAIVKTVNQQIPAQISFLKKIVNINSGTTNIPGVKKVGFVLIPELKKLGFATKWLAEPASFHRAPTLIAERKGKQGKRLLLIGHLDTVFPANSPFQKFEEKKNTIKGPGVIDDKGGVVVLLYALKALQAQHALDNTTITIVLTGDEEDSGKPASISRLPLINAAKQSDVALDFEPSITLETATIARRGISNWSITVKGNESHSATIFQQGVGAGAIFELARIVDTLRQGFMNEKYLTFNPGLIAGGTQVNYNTNTSTASVFGKQNIVAKAGVVTGDVRFLTNEQREAFKKNFAALVSQHLPSTQAELSFQDGMPAMPPTDNNLSLLKKYSEVSKDLGYGEVKAFDPALRGAGDISYVADMTPFNLSGLGPIGYGTHSILESLEISSLNIQTARAALLIYRLSHEQ